MLALEAGVDVVDLAVRARRRRGRFHEADGEAAVEQVATTQTACITPPATLACSASQSIQPSRLRASGDGSSSDAARIPGSSRPRPPAATARGRCRRRSRRDHARLAYRPPVLQERLGLARGRLRATAATTAALMPPTLVPHTISTRSPRAASAGTGRRARPPHRRRAHPRRAGRARSGTRVTGSRGG